MESVKDIVVAVLLETSFMNVPQVQFYSIKLGFVVCNEGGEEGFFKQMCRTLFSVHSGL